MLVLPIHPGSKSPFLPSGTRPAQTDPGTRPGTDLDHLAAPFEALRFQYANAVKAGLLQRSILASGRLERAIDRLEGLILGPLARQR